MMMKESIIDSYTFNSCEIITLDNTHIDSNLNLQIVFYAYDQFEEVHMHIKIFSKKYEEELDRYSYYFEFKNFNNDNIVKKLSDYSTNYNVCLKLMLNNCNFLDDDEREYYRLVYS